MKPIYQVRGCNAPLTDMYGSDDDDNIIIIKTTKMKHMPSMYQ